MRGLVITAAVAFAATAVHAQPPTEDAADVTDQAEGKALPVSARLDVQYRMLGVVDEDPENDQYLFYVATLSGQVLDGLTAFVQTGLLQRFVAEPDESGLYLRDTLIGARYSTPVELGAGLKLGLVHELGVYLPTSRASQNQDLYAAPRYRLLADLEVLPGLSVSAIPEARYRFHAYAERAGPGAPLNTQVDFGARLGLDYVALDSKTWGVAGVGASAASYYARRYAARDGHESDTSDQSPWLQSYDWEGHVFYIPMRALQVAVSVEHGGNVLRDGIANVFFTHRDETELVFTLTGKY